MGFKTRAIAKSYWVPFELLLVLLALSGNSRAGSRVEAWAGPNAPAGFAAPANLTNAIAIVVASSMAELALTSGGQVVEFGPNAPDAFAPPVGLSNVVALSGSETAVGALRRDGTVVAWGDKDYGSANQTVPAGLSNIVAISVGINHSLALRSDGRVFAWGLNDFGDGDVPADLSDVVAIASGGVFSLALIADGTVRAWGDGFFGELQVPEGLTNVIGIAAGSAVGFAVKADGTIVEWGAYPGAFGGTNEFPHAPKSTNIVKVVPGRGYNLALTADGMVAAWGKTNSGYEYLTSAPPRWTNVVAISAGGVLSLALVEYQLVPKPRVLVNSRLSSGLFSTSCSSRSGKVYRLEYKNSLVEKDWTALPLVAGNGGTLPLTDPHPSVAQRFYRVREW